MPAEDGAGWLVRLFPYAPAALFAAGVLVAIYCLYLTLKPRQRHLEAEEKLLLVFTITMLIVPIALLIGISAWFATLSIHTGISTATGFTLASVAFLLKD